MLKMEMAQLINKQSQAVVYSVSCGSSLHTLHPLAQYDLLKYYSDQINKRGWSCSQSAVAACE